MLKCLVNGSKIYFLILFVLPFLRYAEGQLFLLIGKRMRIFLKLIQVYQSHNRSSVIKSGFSPGTSREKSLKIYFGNTSHQKSFVF